VADTRYLKKRRQGWYFQLAVPRELRAKAGKATITASLETRDLTVAQERRWAKLVEAQRALAELAGRKAPANETFAPELLMAIDDYARTTYHRALARMAEDERKGVRAWGAPELDQGWQEAFNGYVIETDFKPVAEPLAAYCTEHAIEPGTLHYQMIGDALLSARLAALRGRKNALEGKPSAEPTSFLLRRPIDPISLKPFRATSIKPGELRFSQAASNFIEEAQRDPAAKMTEQTRKQHEAAYRLFRDFTNDAPLHAIDRAMASDFLTKISRLHPDWARSPKSKQLSLSELLAKYGNGAEQLSNKTLNRAIGSLSSVFKHARRRGHFDGANPFSEQTRPKARKGTTEWLPFSDDELSTLFSAPLFSAADRVSPKAHSVESAMRWVPLIALFSGLRLGEVCSLRTTDIQQEGDVRFFNVTESGEDNKRLKTEAATRRVPIHSKLTNSGLLEYCHLLPPGRLFPGLTPGGPDKKLSWTVTQAFTRLRRKLGITRPRVSFHSLRKNMGTALDRARVPQADIALILGHERGFTLSVYAPLGLELPALQAIVERAQFNVDLSHLYVF
jgi:integrase